ncbi:TmcC family electron transfer complex membrane anchor subunit [Thermodesulfobacterium hydrogeniphilum]|uniref:TmcC family electron transfer complex membrane anchor subunit n=1 Tax=Thermodesulfobacterium hydrogeniphilum TaxID=161156 RepID=UPI00056DD8B5|nr:nitrate reductase [Thermodesulfobacterium hydrogeniphilum]
MFSFDYETLYTIVRGPLVWVSFIAFLGGIVYKILYLSLKAKKDKIIYTYLNFKCILRSIIHWLCPYGSLSMRRHPWFTFVSFIFHIGIILTPIFFLGHIELWEESWGISWKGFPNFISDILTITTITCGILLLIRRLSLKHVRFLTTSKDYALLLLVIGVFLTGILAHYQVVLDYRYMVVLHMLLGEIMLIVIPFTRLGHMFLFWLTRAHTASEFQGVRHSKDY